MKCDSFNSDSSISEDHQNRKMKSYSRVQSEVKPNDKKDNFNLKIADYLHPLDILSKPVVKETDKMDSEKL